MQEGTNKIRFGEIHLSPDNQRSSKLPDNCSGSGTYSCFFTLTILKTLASRPSLLANLVSPSPRRRRVQKFKANSDLWNTNLARTNFMVSPLIRH